MSWKTKFTKDPDWNKMQKLMEEFVEPIQDVMTIDTTRTAENVLAEVKARQIAVQRLRKFLSDMSILSKPYERPKKYSFE